MTDRPLPPTDINTRRPRVATIRNVTFDRFYSRGHNPIFFNRSIEGRLNSPNGSFGVLYAAKQTKGAFAETFLRSPGRRLLPVDLIERKGLVRLKLTRLLKGGRVTRSRSCNFRCYSSGYGDCTALRSAAGMGGRSV